MYENQCQWTVLAITCRSKLYASAIQEQLELKQELGSLPKSLAILYIEDPLEGIGSGGATLNALLVVTEHLSARSGYNVVTSDVLNSSRILIMHFGRHFSYDPCGRSFVCLPVVSANDDNLGLVTNFDALFNVVTKYLAPNSPPGLWICSCDMLLSISAQPMTASDWEALDLSQGAVCFAVPASYDYGTKHGVLLLDKDSNVLDLLYRKSCTVISQCSLGNSMVPIVAGIVFFSTFATEQLLATHTTPPLDACTYLGIDSGCEPLGLSLFFDILLPMTAGINKEDFICGKRSGRFGQEALTSEDNYVNKSRTVLWKHLNSIHLKAYLLKEAWHHYLDMSETPSQFCANLQHIGSLLVAYQYRQIVHSHKTERTIIADDAVVINSIIEGTVKIAHGCTVVHSHLSGDIEIGDNCYIYGVDQKTSLQLNGWKIPSNCVVIGMAVQFHDRNQTRLFAAMNDNDNLLGLPAVTTTEDDRRPTTRKNTGNGFSRQDMISAAVSPRPLPASYTNAIAQSQQEESIQSYFMAKLFPVFHPQLSIDICHTIVTLRDKITIDEMNLWLDCWRCSLCELIENVDYAAEFEHQQSLFLAICFKKMRHILFNSQDLSLLSFIKAFITAKQHNALLEFFDQAAVDAVDEKVGSKRRPDISARCFACIADVLGIMAGNKAGLRSGPSANKIWRVPLSMLEEGRIKSGVVQLAEVRKQWLHHPDLLMRASRHYEGAEQILIRHAVKSATSFVQTTSISPLPFGQWYYAYCPARVDVAGGWTDTPPICYEYGGSVVNVAVLLNGKRPIGARVRKIKKPVLILTMIGNEETCSETILCTALDQLHDYYQPQATGALLKACCIASGIVHLHSTSLADYLLSNHGSGFELQTWSHLPRGSGLGTSSILAGAIMSVLFRAACCAVDVDSLLHSVLVVEQMLTTGGGWQDQVGGMVGGIKIARSSSCLPLHITTETLCVSKEFISSFSQHLKLIYTGKTRLARNLLQSVLRNWYTKRQDILDTCYQLKNNAEECAQAFKDEDLARIGHHINLYWNQKKVMAPGCEPQLCSEIMEKLTPLTFGQALTGAGGGGFMYIITKKPMKSQEITDILRKVDGGQNVVVYDVQVDEVGLICGSQSASANG